MGNLVDLISKYDAVFISHSWEDRSGENCGLANVSKYPEMLDMLCLLAQRLGKKVLYDGIIGPHTYDMAQNWMDGHVAQHGRSTLFLMFSTAGYLVKLAGDSGCRKECRAATAAGLPRVCINVQGRSWWNATVGSVPADLGLRSAIVLDCANWYDFLYRELSDTLCRNPRYKQYDDRLDRLPRDLIDRHGLSSKKEGEFNFKRFVPPF